MLKSVSAWSAASLCFVIPIAEAQDAPMRLDPVDVAGFRPVAPDDLTVSVTRLDAADLAVRDAPFLADQLRAAPGVGVSRSGAFGGLTQIRLRGAEANHTLVLIDGIEVSDPVTGETDFGLWSGLQPARVEILRGEQSALYGSDAIGGVISIETADAAGLSAGLEAGSRDTVRGRTALGGDFLGANGALALSAFRTRGVDTAGLDGERDGSASYSALTRARTVLPGGVDAAFLARIGYSEVETDPDLDFDGQLDNGDRETESLQTLIGAAFGAEIFGVDNDLRINWNRVGRNNFADGVFTDDTVGERFKVAWSPSIAFETGPARHILSGLIEYEDETFERAAIPDDGRTQTASADLLGFAGEYRFALGGLDLQGSVRHDRNDLFDDATTWRAGAAYGFGFGGRLRGSIGEGVKNPTFDELFGFFPAFFAGNPDLVPERSESWEVGWDQRFGDHFEGSVTYFEAELEDEIFTDFSVFPFTAANRTGLSDRRGVEVEAFWRPIDTLTVRGAFTEIDSENDTGADEIRVPDWTASASLAWADKGFDAAVAVDVVGEQQDVDFSTFSDVTLDTYAIVSATASAPLSDRVSLTFRGENLTDEDIIDVVGFNQPGIAVLVGLRVR
ncbi:MAG: TonB-dependent receptor [Pseudomonadota bacterium]